MIKTNLTARQQTNLYLLMGALLLVLVLLPMSLVNAQTPTCTSVCYVNASTGSNSNGGASAGNALLTIQEGINRVTSGGQVIVASGTYNQAIDIAKSLSLLGAGANTTTILGTTTDDVIDISTSSIITIDGFTITNGGLHGVNIINTPIVTIANSIIANNRGRGITNTGNLTVNTTTVRNNLDDGIFNNAGTLFVSNSTVNGNADDGIYNFGNLTTTNTTVSGNTDDGIQNDPASGILSTLNFTTIATNDTGLNGTRFVFRNTLVANNVHGNCTLSGALTNSGNNLSSDNTCPGIPQSSQIALGSLGDNGGPTLTHALALNSSAINAVANCTTASGTAVNQDQRTVTRPLLNACDIGAFERDQFARITITKDVTIGNTSQEFDFTGAFNFSLNDGESMTFQVVAGTYRITEVLPQGWVLLGITNCGVVNGSPSAGSVAPIVDSQQNITGVSFTINNVVDIACTIQNQQGAEFGSLDVTKVVNWGNVPVNPQQSFQICITGPSYPNGNCQTLGANGGILSWNNLVPGTYAVDETTPSGNWNVQEPSPVVVAGNQTATATVTNTNTTPTTGDLDVTKVVDWSGFAPNQAVIFEICITGPSYPNGDCEFTDFDGGTLSWDNLAPGPYVVNEVDPVANWGVQEPNSPVLVVAGQTATATVTNTYNPPRVGDITIRKVVDWNGVTPDNSQTFMLCINGDGTNNLPSCQPVGYNGGSVTFNDAPAGSYNVYELDPGDDWTASGGGNVTVSIGATATATITNVHDEPVIDPPPPPPTCNAEADLVGWIVMGATTATGYIANEGPNTCQYQVGMASYEMFDEIIDNQVLFDSVNVTVTLAPQQQTTLTVNLPACATQVDLFYGDTLLSLNGFRYGDRLLAFVRHTAPGYCVPTVP